MRRLILVIFWSVITDFGDQETTSIRRHILTSYRRLNSDVDTTSFLGHILVSDYTDFDDQQTTSIRRLYNDVYSTSYFGHFKM
jgi:hypothetical protein